MSDDMASVDQPPYLYLRTTGRKTGKPHEIEIWFVEHTGNYYLVSEYPERSDWVKNVLHNPMITFRVGNRSAEPVEATGRPVDRAAEPELASAVARLMDAKYNWSNGQIVELKPDQ